MKDKVNNDAAFRFSRRGFIKTAGPTAATAMAGRVDEAVAEMENVRKQAIAGPAPTPVELDINGKIHRLELEPRVTLLEVLRNRIGHTGSKEVCDRAQCGACTVLLDNEPVNACMMLAIAAQGKPIRTIEGISASGELTPLQKEFVEHDALMCGFCTPGFVTSLTALLEQVPNATDEQISEACSGHLCRCGTYPKVLEAARAAAGRKGAI
jgi:aerobic-type carbon monoxide dehydrogenase small subunit (CoxS/CutS family)